MDDYSDLISEYSDMYQSIIEFGLISTAIAIVLIVIWYIYRRKHKKKLKELEEQKLIGYFEKYSDIIADKVIEKLKNNQ